MNPLRSGLSTSEGKLTVVAVGLGVVCETAATAIHLLQGNEIALPWFPAVLALIGVLLQVASLFGYQKGRAVVKAAAIESGLVDASVRKVVDPDATPAERPSAGPTMPP